MDGTLDLFDDQDDQGTGKNEREEWKNEESDGDTWSDERKWGGFTDGDVVILGRNADALIPKDNITFLKARLQLYLWSSLGHLPLPEELVDELRPLAGFDSVADDLVSYSEYFDKNRYLWHCVRTAQGEVVAGEGYDAANAS